MFIKVHEVNVEVRSNDQYFLEKLKQEFQGFLEKDSEQPDILIEFYGYNDFFKQNSVDCEKIEYEKIGSEFYIKDNVINWDNKNFKITAEIGETINIKGKYIERMDHTIRKFVNRNIKDNNYSNIIRHFVHYPIIFFLENYKSKQVIHASSIEKNNKAILLVGYNGAGKSSVAASAFYNKNYNILTDNFTIIDEKCAYSFPESIKLKKEVIKKINEKISFSDNNKVFNKYKIKKERTALQHSLVGAICIIKINNKSKTNIKLLKKDEALAMINSMHNYLSEFPDYSYFAAVPYLQLPNYKAKKKQPLETLLEKVPVYSLSVSNNMDFNEIMREFENEILCT